MLYKSKKSFSLMEMLIVLVIVGVLLTFAMPNFFSSKRKATEQEMQAMLRLIAQAEDIYRLEVGGYTTCPKGGQDCNQLLRLDLPTTATYQVKNATESTFCAEASSSTTPTIFRIDQTDTIVTNSFCP